MHGSITLKEVALATVAILWLAGCGQREPPADVPAPQTPASAPPAAAMPSLASMHLAEAPQKLGVAADLRYQFDGQVRTGQPAELHLAVVPRVEGSNLTVSVKKEPGLVTTAGELSVSKVGASTAYRHDVVVNRLAGGPSQIKVLVRMETPAGSAHSWFTIPLDGEPATGKQPPGDRLE